METVSIIAFSALIGALIAYLATRASYLKTIKEQGSELAEAKSQLGSQATTHATAMSSLRATHESVVEQFESLKTSSDALKEAHDKWKGDAIKLGEQLAAEKTSHGSALAYKEKFEDQQQEAQKWRNEATRLGEQLKAQNDSLDELKTTKNMFLEEFKKASNEVLLSTNSKFTQESNEKINSTLSPFKEKLKEFQDMVEKIRNDEIREATDLKGEIQSIRTLNEKLSQDANNLANALKSNNKTAGNWGEIILERVMEMSGLRKGYEYVLQASGLDLKNEDGGSQRPDAIIMLPDNKHLIVDSKVTMKSYERYHSAEDPETKAQAYNEFIASVKTHIKGLSEKEYHVLNNLVTPQFVLLFIPIEGAFSMYVESGEESFKYAHERSIYVVSPTTLMTTLKTIAAVWRQEKQNKNAAEIADLAGKIYDKFVTMEEFLEELDKSMIKSRKSFDNFKSRLCTGRSNFVHMLQDMKVLGANTSKEIAMDYEIPGVPVKAESTVLQIEEIAEAAINEDEDLLK